MTQIIKDNQTDNIRDEKIVLTGGCFDILHNGHLQFLRKARIKGNKLVVLLESDENIKKLKGPDRPINNQQTRARNLAKTGIVDYIVLLRTPKDNVYYYNLVKSVHPAIIAVTKGDPILGIKKNQAELVGGVVYEVMERDLRYSTSKLVDQNAI